MRCEFCEKPVVGSLDPITVQGRGPAHRGCLLALEYQQRVFKSITISQLSDDQLDLLHEYVLSERNYRQGISADATQAVEFF